MRVLLRKRERSKNGKSQRRKEGKRRRVSFRNRTTDVNSQSTKLLEGLQSTSHNQGSPVPSLEKHASYSLAESGSLQDLSSLRDAALQNGELPHNLLVRRLRVNFPEYDESLSGLVLLEENPRRLGKPDEQDQVDDRGSGSEADHVPPAVLDVSKGCSDSVGENLTEGDGDDVAVGGRKTREKRVRSGKRKEKREKRTNIVTHRPRIRVGESSPMYRGTMQAASYRRKGTKEEGSQRQSDRIARSRDEENVELTPTPHPMTNRPPTIPQTEFETADQARRSKVS